MLPPQQYCLRWKYHHSNLQTMFSQLLDRGCFCDVTLACEGQLIRAHRVVLCACSTFFDTVLSNYANERDPIIIMKDVTFAEVKCLIEFMYKGEINVEQTNLASLLKTADDLKIKGLAEVSYREDADEGPPLPMMAAAELHSPTRNPSDGYVSEGHQLQHQQQQQHHHQQHQYQHHQQQQQQHHHHQHYHQQQQHLRSSSPTSDLENRSLIVEQTLGLPCMPAVSARASGVSGSIDATPTVEHYLGPKRKRGRPPLDDAYDVFNVRKLAQYAASMDAEQRAYLESARHYAAAAAAVASVGTAAVTAEEQQATATTSTPAPAPAQAHQQQPQSHPRQVSPTTTSPPLRQRHLRHQVPQAKAPQPPPRNTLQPTPPTPPPTSAAAAAALKPMSGLSLAECDASELPVQIAQHVDVDGIVDEDDNDEHDTNMVDVDEHTWVSNSLVEVHVAECSADTHSKHSKQEDTINAGETEQQGPDEPEPLDVAHAPSTQRKQDKSDKNEKHEKRRDIRTPERKERHGKLRHMRRSLGELRSESQLSNSRTIEKTHSKGGGGGDVSMPKEATQHVDVKTETVTSFSQSIENIEKDEETQAQKQQHQHNNNGSGKQQAPPRPGSQQGGSFGKYAQTAPEGYLVNEHGILMTHDFVHATPPNVAISTTASAAVAAAAAVAATANGSSGLSLSNAAEHTNIDYMDIKLEDFDAADLRLTSEEMSQWQDVIKMDDYLAKGRRPQFWEEPFTKRVLDAIKNKRLEMKKAARILGVSYGTLYGRYREVYGCLKHPYSSSAFRNSTATAAAQLAVQPRFDLPFRNASGLPVKLELGKIRTKDLSELWTRPQI